MVTWYSLFSHTGKETETIYSLIDNELYPLVAITNNVQYAGTLPCVFRPTGREINEWLMRPGNVVPGSLITLNGYMKIIPAEVLDYLYGIRCKIYNIHPAPIQLYPELRGRDPQERLYEGLKSKKYSYIGPVIHEVDAGVDTGNIKAWKIKLPVNVLDESDLYEELHRMGTELWIEFFRKEMWKDGTDS